MIQLNLVIHLYCNNLKTSKFLCTVVFVHDTLTVINFFFHFIIFFYFPIIHIYIYIKLKINIIELCLYELASVQIVYIII